MLDNLTPSLIVTSSATEHEPLTNNTDKKYTQVEHNSLLVDKNTSPYT